MIRLARIILEASDNQDIEDIKRDVQMARSVKFWMEPEFGAEARAFPKNGTPNSIEKHNIKNVNNGVGFASYDSKGEINGILSFNDKGMFKIVTREDSLRQGIGMELLDYANAHGVDLLKVVGKNNYSNSGRSLILKWLDKQ